MSDKKESRIVNTIASLAGSLSAAIICSPLDVIKTRMQIQVFFISKTSNRVKQWT